MAINIWPSANDIHGSSPGQGNKWLELKGVQWVRPLAGENFVLVGLTLPASDADLTIDVGSGQAWIDGHFVSMGTVQPVTLTANQTNHIFLKMIKDGGGLANDAQLEANTTGTPPADSVKIGTAVAGASAVSSTTDARVLGSAAQHNHTTVAQGGSGLTKASLTYTAKIHTTAAYDPTVGITEDFTVSGVRVGDFTIEHDGFAGGATTLTQKYNAYSQAELTIWQLQVGGNVEGTSVVTHVRWNEI